MRLSLLIACALIAACASNTPEAATTTGSQVCSECRGDGRCVVCNDTENCVCQGAEQCTECAGSGTKDGETCPHCEGGKECLHCSPMGVIFECENCSANSACPNCGGSGKT
jgi:hypothetical protein